MAASNLPVNFAEIAIGAILIHKGVADVKSAVSSSGSIQAGAGTGSSPAGAVAPTSGSETSFITAVLASMGAPATQANINSLASWFKHEFPSWPPSAAYNPMASTQGAAGATTFNSVGVKNYANAAEGVAATVQTLTNGNFPCIVAALKGGGGLCGQCAADFSKWSGGGYSGVC